MLTKKVNLISVLVVAIFLTIWAIYQMGLAGKVFGNATSLVRGCQTSTATTTLVYQTPGAATTTLACDMTNGGNLVADSAVFKAQLTASTTTTRPKIEFEYADNTPGFDCVATPTACDWYQDNTASTTPDFSEVGISSFKTWTFASSTVGGQVNTTQIVRKEIPVRITSKYVRAIMTLQPGVGGNGAWWGEFVSKKQNQ